VQLSKELSGKKQIPQRRTVVKRIDEEREPQGSTSVHADSFDGQEAIRQRAYQIYEQRGMTPGSEVEDWLQAEAELHEVPRIDTVRQQKDLQLQKNTQQRTNKAA
jgi:hypothetical protein